MPSVCSTLEKLHTENHIPLDMVNRIVVTKKMPIEFAQYFGFDTLSQQITTNNPSMSMAFNRNFYVGCSSSGFSSPNYGATSPNHQIPGAGLLASNVSTSQSFGNFAETNSASQSPIHYNLSGTSSPNPYLNAAAASPMHQITKGISGLTTGGGSITRGTSLASESACNQPLDLTTENR